jgi:hypothetical protein
LIPRQADERKASHEGCCISSVAALDGIRITAVHIRATQRNPLRAVGFSVEFGLPHRPFALLEGNL